MSLTKAKLSFSSVKWMQLALMFASIFISADLFAQQFQKVEKRKVRHILVRTEKEADNIIQQVEKGASFASIARRKSYDVVTKRLGGDLGLISIGQMQPEFEAVAWKLPEGKPGKAKTVYGWHVIQVDKIVSEMIPLKPKEPSIAGKPKTKPFVAPAVPKRDASLKMDLSFKYKAHDPGQDVYYTLSLKNVSDQPQQILAPSLWPLGLTVRYEKGKLNAKMMQEAKFDVPAKGFASVISPGQTISHQYRLQDFAGPVDNWPIIRINWRGNILMRRIAQKFPDYAATEDYGDMKSRWRFYFADEEHINVLPDPRSSQEKWYALAYVSGGAMWIELEDPGVPGLLANWINTVRTEYYDKVEFSHLEKGSYVVSGPGEDAKAKRFGFDLPDSWHRMVPAVTANSMCLFANNPSTRRLGSSLSFTMSDLDQGNMRMIKIGKVRLGSEALGRINENFDKPQRGSKSRITRIDVYPESILPPKVQSVLNEKAVAEVRPVVEIQTKNGNFRIELFEDEAPNTVAHFIHLVESGFYDGLKFHRKESNRSTRGFIQGGSPTGDSKGELGYYLPDEKNSLSHKRGTVSLARIPGQKNTGGPQFFVCLDELPSFDGQWTVFGQIISGLAVVDGLKAGAVMNSVKVLKKRQHKYTYQTLPKK